MLTRLIQVTGCDKKLTCAFTPGKWGGDYHLMCTFCTYVEKKKKNSTLSFSVTSQPAGSWNIAVII
jgi:hypothetical protein